MLAIDDEGAMVNLCDLSSINCIVNEIKMLNSLAKMPNDF